MQNSKTNYQGFVLIKPDGLALYSKIYRYLKKYIFTYTFNGQYSIYKIHDFSLVFKKVQEDKILKIPIDNYLSFLEKNYRKETILILFQTKCQNDNEYITFLEKLDETKFIIRKELGGNLHPDSSLLENCKEIDKYLSIIHAPDPYISDVKKEFEQLNELNVFDKNNLLNNDIIKSCFN